jgi:hypothetical protein
MYICICLNIYAYTDTCFYINVSIYTYTCVFIRVTYTPSPSNLSSKPVPFRPLQLLSGDDYYQRICYICSAITKQHRHIEKSGILNIDIYTYVNTYICIYINRYICINVVCLYSICIDN